MTASLRPFAIALLCGLAACTSLPADYTTAEAPNQLVLANASSQVAVRFVPGSDRLAAGEAQRLTRMIARGEIEVRDRVLVSPSGPPALAERRAATLHALFLHYGLVVATQPLAAVPRDTALIAVERYLVTLPPCPNWSKPPTPDYTNMPLSNEGCATNSDLGLMVANPADLAVGRPLSAADGTPAAAAVGRYLSDKVVLPTANSALPIAAPSNAAPGAGNGNSPTPGSQ